MKEQSLMLLTDTTSITKQVMSLREMVIRGDIDPLKAFVNIARVAEVIEMLKKDELFLDAAMREYSKYGEKNVTLGICTVTEAQVGTKYDFSQCNDSALNDLYEQQAQVKNDVKERETMLKALPSKLTIINDRTGEVTEVLPPVKTSKTTLKLTFNKK